MADHWMEALLGLNAALLIFILERLFNLASKFGTMKSEILLKFQGHKDEVNVIFQKQIHEGILAHKRMDTLDRLVSATTDTEFGSSKNIATGNEDFPETTRIRRLVKSANG